MADSVIQGLLGSIRHNSECRSSLSPVLIVLPVQWASVKLLLLQYQLEFEAEHVFMTAVGDNQ
jgi:hypothetical protein